MARLSVSLLGGLEATLDGEPVTSFRSTKARALLTYLVVEADRAHPREILATLLWPDRPGEAARTNLRRELSNLRKAIGDRPPSGDHETQPPFLHVTRESIQFNIASDCWIDVAAFTDLLMAEDEAPVGQLERAVALYRGPFLEGFFLKDSAAFDDWSLLTRERLHRQALAALRHLAEEHERSGELERACEVARRRVELEPWQEEAHRRLMRLLALRGQRSAALAQYEACRRTLRDELGVEPAEETRALYQRIRDGAQLPAPPRGPPHNLPTSLIPFVGRERLLAEIRSRLQDPTCRLLSLVGPGGSGKTRLALETAARQLHRFGHGAFFVSLAPLQSADGIVPTMAQALDVPLATGAEADPQRQLLDYLRDKDLLLVFDNFEHLLEGVGLVAHILRRAPDVKVIATSRARLNARGEHLMSVPGMDVPPLDAQEALSQYSAVQLFLESGRRARADFEPTAEELGQVARICQLVEGMPLAILIAASWVSLLTPGEIATQISTRSLDFLKTEWRDVPARQRSMRAVFDHSWSLLTEREREVVAGMSVLRGGFLHEAAQEVAGASLRELMSLADRSLLQRTASGRYELHELVRKYAEEKLALSPAAEEAALGRHCAYYVLALQMWEADLRGPRQREALAEMQADIEDTRAAWDWAAQRGDVTCIDEAMEGLCRFYERHARFQEGERAARLAVEQLSGMERELTGDELRVLARAYGWQGRFNRALGRTGLARQLLEQGLALLDSPLLGEQDRALSSSKGPGLSKGPVPSSSREVRWDRAFLLEQLGHTAYMSDRQDAARYWQQSLALYRALSDRWATANVLTAFGHLCLDIGQQDRGRRMYDESLALRRSLGDRTGIADTLLGLSYAANQQGRLEEAGRLVREAVAIRHDIGDRVGTADARQMLIATLVHQGRFGEAHDLLKEIVSLREGLGMRIALVRAKSVLAWVKVNMGLYSEAWALNQECLATWRDSGRRPGIAMRLLCAGEIALASGAYSEAHPLLQESAAVLREIGQGYELALALMELGHAERGLGRPIRARRCLREGLRAIVGIEAHASSRYSLSLASLVLADQGDVERAIELYALAMRYPAAANSRYWEAVAGKHIAALAATLPPKIVAAAQERGRARDLETTVTELLMELEEDQVTEDLPWDRG